jgi:hypothetical protein
MSLARKTSRPFRQHFHAARNELPADRPLEVDIIQALDQLAVASSQERLDRDMRRKAAEAARPRPEAAPPARLGETAPMRPFRYASLAPVGGGMPRITGRR